MRKNKQLGADCIYGFPVLRGGWCNNRLKTQPLDSIARLRKNKPTKGNESDIRRPLLHRSDDSQRPEVHRETDRISLSYKTSVVQLSAQGECANQSNFSDSSLAQGADTNIVQYLGIAADETQRIERHTRSCIVLPLVGIGWDEAYCRKWCEENDLLSSIYTTAARGGCWFCHNQSVDQLRLLRKDYPELWELLLKWDWDSPVAFKPDGRTVHDYDLRFLAEELNLVPKDRKFRWKALENLDYSKEYCL